MSLIGQDRRNLSYFYTGNNHKIIGPVILLLKILILQANY